MERIIAEQEEVMARAAQLVADLRELVDTWMAEPPLRPLILDMLRQPEGGNA